MKNPLLIFASSILLLGSSCQKGEIAQPLHSIQFIGAVVPTKSSSPLAVGAVALLQLFKIEAGVEGGKIGEYTLVSHESGTLISTAPIFLESGEYSFYSLTENGSSLNVTPSVGNSLYLQSGKEYMRACKERIKIEDNLSIYLDYQRLLSKLRFQIVSNQEYGVIVLNWLKVSTPQDGLYQFHLAEGAFVEEPVVGPLKIVEEQNGLLELIVQPCNTTLEIELSIEYIVGGKSFPNILCSGSLPLQTEAGHLYLIKLTPNINSDPSISFRVEEWERVEQLIEFSKRGGV
ncbi:MAG: hypothetical protein WC960_06100 [Bacteroidales bacterium]